MPWGDGTGPAGEGPMTGRGRGYCAGFDAPGCADVRPGRGWGGRGARNMYRATGVPGWVRFGGGRIVGGRFRGRRFDTAYLESAPASQEERANDEARALRAQAEYLEEALQEVRARLANLEREPE